MTFGNRGARKKEKERNEGVRRKKGKKTYIYIRFYLFLLCFSGFPGSGLLATEVLPKVLPKVFWRVFYRCQKGIWQQFWRKLERLMGEDLNTSDWTVIGETLAGNLVSIRTGCTLKEATEEAKKIRLSGLFPQIKKDRANDKTLHRD